MANDEIKQALLSRLEFKKSPLGTLLDHLSTAVLILDENGIITYLSPSGEKALGRTAKQLTGTRALDLVVAEDHLKARKAFEFIKEKTDIPITASVRVSKGDGTRHRVDVIFRNHLEDKVVKGVVVVSSAVGEAEAGSPEADRGDLERGAITELLRTSLEDLPIDRLLEKGLRLLTSRDWLPLEPWANAYLLGEQTRLLTLAAHFGSDYHQRPCAELTLDRCSMGKVVRSGAIAVQAPGEAPDPECPQLCPPGRVSLPVMSGKKVVGVLNVCFADGSRPSERDLLFLSGFAAILAGMIVRYRHSEENARLAEITRENPNPVIVCNSRGEFTYENPTTRKLLWQHSVDLEDLLPQNHRNIISACVRGSCSTRRAESAVGERTYSWTYHPVPASGRVHIFGRDITERRRAERQIVHDAMHDGLTGLPNRNLILDRISTAMGIHGRRDDFEYAVILLDLDRFKVITESLGPSTGDRVLRKAAQRILESVKERCTVGRLGGDEFVVLLEDLGREDDVSAIARAILERINEPMDVGEHRVVISATAGVVCGRMEYATPEDVLRDADTAMYRAKAEGRGRFEIFDITMRSNVVARMQVQSDLREAIENGDLLVHYQPVLALRDLRIRGFEALVRWRHPTRGMVAPPEFIAVAEETGLIIPLGELVLRDVCRLLRKWKDMRLPLAWVAVNLSAHQFEVRDLVRGILSTIDDIGAPAERVQFEITEGTAAANPERAVIMLHELRERGIKVALDDFGTGYSSMAYLKRFPIDALKLDRSFVKDLPESHDDAAIATSIIAMARSLGLKTVAEGVEDERQAMFLKSHGCDEVQGFLYARPMREDDATALLRKGFSGVPHQDA